MKRLLTTITLAAVIACLNAGAAQREIILSDKDGLCGGSVKCIHQDSKGFMWFGTWNGLARYDGSHFVTFNSEPGNPNTLHDNIVDAIIEGQEGTLWILNEAGISRLTHDGNEIKSFEANTGLAIHNASKSLDANSNGLLLYSVSGWGLALFDNKTESFVPLNVPGIDDTAISTVAFNTDSTVVLRTFSNKVLEYGIFKKKDGAYEISAPAKILDTQDVTMVKRDGSVIFLVTDGTIFKMEGRTITGQCSTPKGLNAVTISSYSPSNATITYDNNEAYSLDFIKGTYALVNKNGGDILSLLHTKDGITWVGIDGLGIKEIYNENLLFENMFPDDMETMTLSLGELPSGAVIAGTIGNGIHISTNGSQFRKAKVVGSFTGRYVYTIYKCSNGDLLLGGYDEIGIVRSQHGDTITIDRICTLPGSKIYSIYMDEKNNNIWCGTFTQLLRVPFKRSGTKIIAQAPITFSATDEYGHDYDFSRSMNMVYSESFDRLLVGSTGSGIYSINPHTCELSKHLSAENGLLSNDSVLSMKVGEKGKLYIGTSYGINIISYDDDRNLQTRVIKDETGLVDNSVHAMLEDGRGNLWVSTNIGIAAVRLSDGTYQSFVNANLQSKEFCNCSALKSSDGTFWFGGTRGCDRFRPETITLRTTNPPLGIRGFIGSDKTVFDFDKTINLSHDENFFSIQYSAIEFIRGADVEYKYILEGLQNDWTDAGSLTRASFTNVPPGDYVFRVRSTNGDKEWCNNEATLKLHISKPWWATGFAFFMYVLIVLAAIYETLKFMKTRTEEKHKLELAQIEKENQAENYEGKLNFFTNLAHEFGTPLTLISTSSEQLMAGSSLLPPADRYVKVINKSAERMQRLISEIVEFRKVESGNMKLQYQKVSVHAIVDNILDDFYDANLKKSVDLTKDLDNGPMNIITDSSALERILYNLISNAYKYVTPGGKLRIKAYEVKYGIRFEIKNSSLRGIKQEDLGKVFDRYTILDTFEKQAGNEKVNRNGLGLAIVKNLVDMLGGWVTVDSVENKNVQFTFFIPDAKDKQTTENVVPELKPEAMVFYDDDEILEELDKTKSEFKIMVVEDNSDMRTMITDILQAHYEVITAANGIEALEMLNFEHPDLIVSDIMMPKMSGMELLEKLRESKATKLIPVVFLTFKTDIESEMVALEKGVDAFIHKPFHSKQLLTVVSNILLRRTSLKSYYSSMQSNMDVYNGMQVTREDKDFVCKLTAAIEDNIQNEDMSLEFLADKMSIGKMTLYRKIKDLTEQTPSEFINKVKINRAIHLLKTTKMTIQEVMFASGYNNKSYFYRKFAEQENMTPKEFREKQSVD